MMYFPNDSEWLTQQFRNLTHELDDISPAEWAEKNRYLPSSVTPLAGYYSYDVCPYMREIVECLDVRSPVREVTVMKGAQVCATVGVLENVIGYCMDHVKNAPMMMVTADNELAKLRMESYIMPMINQSGLVDKIRSNDEQNQRKTGKTVKKLEWIGGGFLLPLGARNSSRLRSLSIRYLLQDEIDAFPQSTGEEADTCKTAEARTKAYHQTRKILRLSTPLLSETSRIEREFKRGDQRFYHVPCKRCNEFQILEFNRKEQDHTYGLIWENDESGQPIPESIRYKCKFCGSLHINSDKLSMLPDGQWIPRNPKANPEIRSYHISGLYSPVTMFPWEAVIDDWCECWDQQNNHCKDLQLLQEFYNNVLGKSFETRGDRITFSAVSNHKRPEYRLGQIHNKLSTQVCGAPIVLLTCAVDVHKDNLAVSVMGWTIKSRVFVIDYWRFNGDTERLDDDNTWGRVEKLIEQDVYVADDGRRYRVQITLIDSSWSNNLVLQFCSSYQTGVYPIIGRETPSKNQSIKEFAPFTTQLGTMGYRITVDIYKDRFSSALRRTWDGVSEQPHSFFNAPYDMTDKQLRELTVEYKREKIDKNTNKRIGFEWYRPSGAKNELWDLLIYNAAALEMVAWDVCLNQLERENVNWSAFWQLLINDQTYIETAQ